MSSSFFDQFITEKKLLLGVSDCLDSAIIIHPIDIGKPQSIVLYSGPADLSTALNRFCSPLVKMPWLLATKLAMPRHKTWSSSPFHRHDVQLAPGIGGLRS